jgi:hypothetical protein
MKLAVSGLDAFEQQCTSEIANLRHKAQTLLRTRSQRTLEWLTFNSPQYSGDFAANWKVGINETDYTYAISLFPNMNGMDLNGTPIPFSQGDPQAPGYALRSGTPLIAGAMLGDTVTISNSVVHDSAYAVAIEANSIKFRPENIDRGRVIGRYMETLRSLPT